MKYLNYLIFIVLFGCNQSSTTVIETGTAVQNEQTLLKSDIEAIKYIDYELDTKAKNRLLSWQTYNDLSIAIENFKVANFSFFVDNEEIFTSTLEEIETTIPEAIATAPIKARFLVLKTKLYKLKQDLELSNTSKAEQLEALKAVLEANSNVILQINKKFEKEQQKINKPF